MLKQIYRFILPIRIRKNISKYRVAFDLFLYRFMPQEYSKPMNFWANRHLNENNWLNLYKDSKTASYRKYFISEIDDIGHSNSFLELGCNCGPNLELILEKDPLAKYLGVDINNFAINEAKTFFKSNHNVDFVCADFNQALYNIPDKKFDIIFSIYSLAYLPPDQLKLLIHHLIRISKKKIIIMEPMSMDVIESKLIYPIPEWSHNYVQFFEDLDNFTIEFEEINEGRMNFKLTIFFN